MSVGIDEFESFFEAIYGYQPFPWQSRLARLVHQKGWPKCIDLPTASGKTAAIDVAIFVLAAQAERPTHERNVGRRVFFTVNRRVIVDEAHERAVKLALKLLDAKDGVIKHVADALRKINDNPDAPPLDVAELRGGIYRDRRWARGISQPTIVATTADQLGSRLLFRGYGVRPVMQPIHAVLTACDSTILLDEAHVTRAFSQTLQAIAAYRKHEATAPPMHFVQMTATPSDVERADCFMLDPAKDLENGSELAKRQNAAKPAELIFLGRVKPEKFIHEFIDRAIKSLGGQRKAVGIIVNRVQTARDIYAEFLEKYPLDANQRREVDVYLVIGRMRPLDRDKLTEQLREVIGPSRPAVLARPCFVVSTQCLEVGADYDFDALITECAPVDALRQRFGRLNRQGRPIEAIAAVLATTDSLSDDDPVYGDAMAKSWKWLSQSDRKSVDFGIAAFRSLWNSLNPNEQNELLSPSADAAVLLPAHLDVLCQTSLPPSPCPDVAYFIHGPKQNDTDVQVCWRADLGENPKDWARIVSMLPPTSPECMSVPIRTLRKWMGMAPQRDTDADIASLVPDEERLPNVSKMVLVWRGKNDFRPTDDPGKIRPGDTLVIPVATGGANELGNVPSDQLDIAERAIAVARRLCIIRIHRNLPHDDIPPELVKHATSNEAALSKSAIRELLGKKGRFEELQYPSIKDCRPGIVLRFSELLPPKNPLKPSTFEEDDDEDSPSEIGIAVSLSDHSQHVIEAVSRFLPHLHLPHLETCLKDAAKFHDYGKADVRFQAMLLGTTPEEAALRPVLLAKSAQRELSRAERQYQKELARLPEGFRHEMLSVAIVEVHRQRLLATGLDSDLLLHLIAAHHGHARPFTPVVIDNEPEDYLLEVSINGLSLSASCRRQAVTAAHQLDSGIAERFWKLTHQHGWWGLAYLESILRLADQQASETEQKPNGKQQ